MVFPLQIHNDWKRGIETKVIAAAGFAFEIKNLF